MEIAIVILAVILLVSVGTVFLLLRRLAAVAGLESEVARLRGV